MCIIVSFGDEGADSLPCGQINALTEHAQRLLVQLPSHVLLRKVSPDLLRLTGGHLDEIEQGLQVLLDAAEAVLADAISRTLIKPHNPSIRNRSGHSNSFDG